MSRSVYMFEHCKHLDGHLVTVGGGIVERSEATAIQCEGSGSSEVTQEVGHTAEGGNTIKSLDQQIALNSVIENLTTESDGLLYLCNIRITM